MKILVNVARQALDEEWHECEAVKLVEESDGAFSLMFTRDLERTRESERKVAESAAAIARAVSG